MFNTLKKKLKKKLFAKKGADDDVGEVLKGGAVSFIYRIATMLVSYGLMFFIARKLGQEGLGIFNLCLAISGLLVMVGCLGFNTSIVRFVSQYVATGQFSTVTALYKSILKFASILGVILGVGFFVSSHYFANVIFKDPNLTLPFQITGLTVPVIVILTINVEFIRGLKVVQISEFFRNLSMQLVALVGTIIASFFVLTAADPLLFYALGAVISLVITMIYIMRYLNKTKVANIISQEENTYSFKYHFLISLPMILTSFIQLINGKIDTLMLGYFADTGIVGVFTMALKLSVITNFVIGALKTIAMPKMAELFWADKRVQLNNVVQYSTKITFLFAFPVSLVLMIFPEFILGLVKEEFVIGANTLRIFALTQLINAWSGMVAVFLNVSGDQLYFTKIVAITTVVNIILNIIFIPLFGMEGAAWATLISTVGWNVLGAIFIYRKYNIMTFYNPFYKSKPGLEP